MKEPRQKTPRLFFVCLPDMTSWQMCSHAASAVVSFKVAKLEQVRL